MVLWILGFLQSGTSRRLGVLESRRTLIPRVLADFDTPGSGILLLVILAGRHFILLGVGIFSYHLIHTRRYFSLIKSCTRIQQKVDPNFLFHSTIFGDRSNVPQYCRNTGIVIFVTKSMLLGLKILEI